MITFTHDTTRFTVKPENAQEYRKLAAKPPKIKFKVDALDRKHDCMKRDYPVFKPGMTTADYVSQFNGLNSRLLLTAWNYDNLSGIAPMLDAAQPEVLEELDPDYIPPTWAPKAKPATAAQLRAALAGLLAAIESGGDIQAATAAAKAVL